MNINPEIKPVIHAHRRVPLNMMDKLKNELDSMVRSRVIAKVDKATPWVHFKNVGIYYNVLKLNVCILFLHGEMLD